MRKLRKYDCLGIIGTIIIFIGFWLTLNETDPKFYLYFYLGILGAVLWGFTLKYEAQFNYAKLKTIKEKGK